MPNRITIMDGGMGRELLKIGAPFKQPEWSALALIEAPSYVSKVHNAFVEAGAEVLTTNSYAVVPFHIGEERFVKDGEKLVDLSGRLARAAAGNAGRTRVAGSIPPLFGSYRPDLFNEDAASVILSTIIKGLSPHVDFWLAETQGSIGEVETIYRGLGSDTRPLWVSFTLEDRGAIDEIAHGGIQPTLRSGEGVAEAAVRSAKLGAAAVLFNCSQAEIMEQAVITANRALSSAGYDLPIGVYANAFVPTPDAKAKLLANSGLGKIREDLNPDAYLDYAQKWVNAGATIIGGCCGIGPEHISRLRQKFDDFR